MGMLSYLPILTRLLTSQQYPNKNEATAQWIQKDETTFDLDVMERIERWQYYTSSYVRVEPTEGVPRSLLRKSVLTRNIPSSETDSDDGFNPPKPRGYKEDLTLRICVNTYKIIYKAPGQEYYIYANSVGNEAESAKEKLEKVRENRTQRFHEKFKMNTAWMKDMTQGQVQKINEDFEKWMKEGVIPSTPVPTAAVTGPEGRAE